MLAEIFLWVSDAQAGLLQWYLLHQKGVHCHAVACTVCSCKGGIVHSAPHSLCGVQQTAIEHAVRLQDVQGNLIRVELELLLCSTLRNVFGPGFAASRPMDPALGQLLWQKLPQDGDVVSTGQKADAQDVLHCIATVLGYCDTFICIPHMAKPVKVADLAPTGIKVEEPLNTKLKACWDDLPEGHEPLAHVKVRADIASARLVLSRQCRH